MWGMSRAANEGDKRLPMVHCGDNSKNLSALINSNVVVVALLLTLSRIFEIPALFHASPPKYDR
jgi:hypothetical protein